MKNAFLLAVLLFGIATGEHSDSTEESLKRGLSNKCAARETSSCIAYELVGYAGFEPATFDCRRHYQLGYLGSNRACELVVACEVGSGVGSTDAEGRRYHDGFVHSVAGETLARTDVTPPDEGPPTGPKPSRYLPRLNPNPESLARSGTSLEDQAQQVIQEKLFNFATTRSLRYRILDNADLVISGQQEKDGSLGVGVSLKAPRQMESGRGRQKNVGPILAAAAMKFGLLGALTFKGLTLMVGKALLISKIALLLATIIGLKKLFSHQGSAGERKW
ncbi:hypothetical protein NE865_02404 [Phthorimaea operculella]|nr:hypothetical protein NE865_02404 [Phthorimaea operculella]